MRIAEMGSSGLDPYIFGDKFGVDGNASDWSDERDVSGWD